MITEVALAGRAGIIGITVARFDIGLKDLNENCGAIKMRILVIEDPVGFEHGIGRDPIEAAEEGDIHVRDIKARAVQRRNRDCTPHDGILHPDAVLEKERRESQRNRDIVAVVAIGKAGDDLTEIAFEKRGFRLCIEQDLVVAEQIALIAAEFDARHAAFFHPIERTQEHMKSFSGGEPEIYVQVQTDRHLGGIDCAVVIVGGAEAEIAEHQQLRPDRVFRAEQVDAGTY